MKFKQYAIIIGFCILVSCQQEPAVVKVAVPNTIDLFQYKTGNMWVYEVIVTQDDSSIIPTFANNDTITVLGDSLIRGHVYKKISETEFGGKSISFYRDSVGCLINSSGKILVSMINQGLLYNHTFVVSGKDTIYSFFDLMDGASRNINVPLGNFNAFSKTRFTTFPTPKEPIKRISQSFYAPGIGLISYEKFFIGSKRASITSKLIQLKL
jgi:hypothetical protein